MLINAEEAKEILRFLVEDDISGWYKSNDGGKYLQLFQKEFASYVGAKYAFGVSSGSASIYVALKALGIGKGDYVLAPTYTHIGSVAPIILAGAKPIFIDCDDYGNIDLQAVNTISTMSKIKDRIKAVIIVHNLGCPAEMDLLYNKNLKIIEDASHAPGAKYKGKRVGTLGDIACFSVGGGRTKTCSIGEGGLIVTNNDELAERIKNIRNHGDRNFDKNYFCFNFRLSDLNAMIGYIQMKKIQFYNDWQIDNALYMIPKLPEYLEFIDPQPWVDSTYYIIGCRFRPKIAGMTRTEFLNKVKDKGFEGGIPRKNVGSGYSKLLHTVKYYSKFDGYCPNSEILLNESVWIDHHRWNRTREEIDQLLECFSKIKP